MTMCISPKAFFNYITLQSTHLVWALPKYHPCFAKGRTKVLKISLTYVNSCQQRDIYDIDILTSVLLL